MDAATAAAAATGSELMEAARAAGHAIGQTLLAQGVHVRRATPGAGSTETSKDLFAPAFPGILASWSFACLPAAATPVEVEAKAPEAKLGATIAQHAALHTPDTLVNPTVRNHMAATIEGMLRKAGAEYAPQPLVHAFTNGVLNLQPCFRPGACIVKESVVPPPRWQFLTWDVLADVTVPGLQASVIHRFDFCPTATSWEELETPALDAVLAAQFGERQFQADDVEDLTAPFSVARRWLLALLGRTLVPFSSPPREEWDVVTWLRPVHRAGFSDDVTLVPMFENLIHTLAGNTAHDVVVDPVGGRRRMPVVEQAVAQLGYVWTASTGTFCPTTEEWNNAFSRVRTWKKQETTAAGVSFLPPTPWLFGPDMGSLPQRAAQKNLLTFDVWASVPADSVLAPLAVPRVAVPRVAVPDVSHPLAQELSAILMDALKFYILGFHEWPERTYFNVELDTCSPTREAIAARKHVANPGEFETKESVKAADAAARAIRAAKTAAAKAARAAASSAGGGASAGGGGGEGEASTEPPAKRARHTHEEDD